MQDLAHRKEKNPEEARRVEVPLRRCGTGISHVGPRHPIEEDIVVRRIGAYSRASVTRANGLRTPELSLSMCHSQESVDR